MNWDPIFASFQSPHNEFWDEGYCTSEEHIGKEILEGKVS